MKACRAKHVIQKARKEAEAKAKKEAEKRRIVEEKEMKKMLEYLQQLQNKVLVEDAEGSKCKEVLPKDDRKC